MNPRIAKEIRLVRPAWLLTAALMIATAFLPGGGKEWAITIVVFGCLIVAASAFGGEFGHGTIPQLLAQPEDRRRMWLEKMLIMASALGSLILLMLSIEGSAWPVAIIAACALCTIPFYTLIGRGTIAGLILSIPIPGILFLIGGLLGLWLLRPSALNEERLHFWMRAYFYFVLPTYCAIVFYLGYRRFLNFELAGREQPQVRLPASMQTRLEQLVSKLIPTAYPHLRSLVAKELHLQHNAMILFLGFIALQLLVTVYVSLAHSVASETFFIAPIFFYAATMPLMIGSSAIAEETNLGIRAWHLTLPCSIRTQWFVKLSVVLLFAILFGVAVPLMWLAVGWRLGVLELASDMGSALGLFFCSPVLLITLIAFYASSFSRDTLRALLTAFGLCAGIVFGVALFSGVFEYLRLLSGDLIGPLLHSTSLQGLIYALGTGWVLAIVPLTCFVILLLRGSLKHFASLDHHRIWSGILLVVITPILLLFLLLSLASAAMKVH
jgi:hypothetical protein